MAVCLKAASKTLHAIVSLPQSLYSSHRRSFYALGQPTFSRNDNSVSCFSIIRFRSSFSAALSNCIAKCLPWHLQNVQYYFVCDRCRVFRIRHRYFYGWCRITSFQSQVNVLRGMIVSHYIFPGFPKMYSTQNKDCSEYSASDKSWYVLRSL